MRNIWFTIFAGLVLGMCAVKMASARPAYTMPRPHVEYPHHPVVIHEKKQDIVPYIFIGVIAGLVIYDLASRPRCEYGAVCMKF